MPQIGPLEIVALAVIALIVFGPQRLPEIARNIGKAVNEARRVAAELRTEFESGLSTEVHDEQEIDEAAKPKPTDPDELER